MGTILIGLWAKISNYRCHCLVKRSSSFFPLLRAPPNGQFENYPTVNFDLNLRSLPGLRSQIRPHTSSSFVYVKHLSQKKKKRFVKFFNLIMGSPIIKSWLDQAYYIHTFGCFVATVRPLIINFWFLTLTLPCQTGLESDFWQKAELEILLKSHCVGYQGKSQKIKVWDSIKFESELLARTKCIERTWCLTSSDGSGVRFLTKGWTWDFAQISLCRVSGKKSENQSLRFHQIRVKTTC